MDVRRACGDRHTYAETRCQELGKGNRQRQIDGRCVPASFFNAARSYSAWPVVIRGYLPRSKTRSCWAENRIGWGTFLLRVWFSWWRLGVLCFERVYLHGRGRCEYVWPLMHYPSFQFVCGGPFGTGVGHPVDRLPSDDGGKYVHIHSYCLCV